MRELQLQRRGISKDTFYVTDGPRHFEIYRHRGWNGTLCLEVDDGNLTADKEGEKDFFVWDRLSLTGLPHQPNGATIGRFFPVYDSLTGTRSEWAELFKYVRTRFNINLILPPTEPENQDKK